MTDANARRRAEDLLALIHQNYHETNVRLVADALDRRPVLGWFLLGLAFGVLVGAVLMGEMLR